MKEIWTDADGRNHLISEMDSKYINNCIKNILKLYRHVDEKELSQDNTHLVFGPWWTYYHAKDYLDAFNQELEVRKRIDNKEYPTISVVPSCDECDKRNLCQGDVVCDEWGLSQYNAYKYFEGIDEEIARRGYYVCNGMTYNP